MKPSLLRGVCYSIESGAMGSAIEFILILAVWLALQFWILPRFGVST
jgi:hypothetical protein